MKSDDFWSFALIETALDSVPHLLAQVEAAPATAEAGRMSEWKG